MDGTVFDLIGKWLNVFNEKHPEYNMCLDDITEFDIKKCLLNKYKNVSDDAKNDIYELIKPKGFFRDLEVLEYCKEYIKKWYNNGHEIIFVSNAMFAPNSMLDKFECLKEHFPFATPVFTPDKSMIKGDVCIEDNATYMRQFQCDKRFLINYKFNEKEFLNEDEFRVNNFKEIDEVISK